MYSPLSQPMGTKADLIIAFFLIAWVWRWRPVDFTAGLNLDDEMYE